MREILKVWLQKPWIRYPAEAGRRFNENNGAINAAGLAFYILLSLPPACLMAAALLSLIVRPSDAMSLVDGILAGLLPGGHARRALDQMLDAKLANTMARMAASSVAPFVIGLLSLVWATMQVYVAGATSMNLTFENREDRSWLRLRLTALGLLIATGVMLSASFWLSGAAQLIARGLFKRLPVGGAAASLASAVAVALAAGVNAGMFALIYKYLPAAHRSWRAAAVGGVVASVLFEVAKDVVAVFFLRPNHGVYGGFADIIVFVLWVYYSTTILIFGGEASAVYARVADRSPGEKLRGRQRASAGAG